MRRLQRLAFLVLWAIAASSAGDVIQYRDAQNDFYQTGGFGLIQNKSFTTGVTQIDLKDDFAPRFGFAWDPTRDGGTKVYGSCGRYYEQLSMDLVIRSFSYERQPRIFNYSPTSTTPDPNAEADLEQSSVIEDVLCADDGTYCIGTR